MSAPKIRLQISNAFGGTDLPITAVTVALPVNGSAGVAGIVPDSLKTVTFSGSKGFNVPNGALVLSDPIDYPVKGMSVLTVSIYLARGQTGNLITSHPGSRTTSHFAPGDQTEAHNLKGCGVKKTEHWYFLTTIEVSKDLKTHDMKLLQDPPLTFFAGLAT